MSQTISLMGATYSDVPSILLPKSGGGTASFVDVTDTTAAASDVASGKYFYTAAGVRTQGTASGGGGSGIGTLLATKSLGTISTSSTSATDTGQTVSVSNINSYDILLVITSVETQTNGRHVATGSLIWLTGSSSVSNKDNNNIATARWNAKKSSAGTMSTRSSTTAYGIYPYTVSIADGNATIKMYQRYNSTQTGTINGNYTTKVYGIKAVDLL